MKKTIFITAIIFFIIIFAINIYIFVLNINNKNLINNNTTSQYTKTEAAKFVNKKNFFNECENNFDKVLIEGKDLKNAFGDILIKKEKLKNLADNQRYSAQKSYCYCYMEQLIEMFYYDFNKEYKKFESLLFHTRLDEKEMSIFLNKFHKSQNSLRFLILSGRINLELDDEEKLEIERYKYELDNKAYFCIKKMEKNLYEKN